jgi:hypothetical protein
MNETDGSSFDVRFLTVDGTPVTVIGPAAAIRALEERLRDVPDVELHGLQNGDDEESPP